MQGLTNIPSMQGEGSPDVIDDDPRNVGEDTLPMFVALVFAKSALKDLLQKIDNLVGHQTGQPNHVKLVIDVDEAHTLADNEAPANADNK
jgi:hypothetical protein